MKFSALLVFICLSPGSPFLQALCAKQAATENTTLELGQVTDNVNDEKKDDEKSPVVLDDRTLFYIGERVFSFSQSERANVISERIRKLSKDPFFDPMDITVIDTENATDIVADDLIIMTVTDKDAGHEGISRKELAVKHAAVIRTAIEHRKSDYSIKGLMLNALYVVITTAVLILILFYIKKSFLKAYSTLRSWENTRVRPIKLQRLEILSARDVTFIIIRFLKIIRFVITALLIYIYVPVVMSFFPWTRKISARVYDYVLDPLKIVGMAVLEFIPDMFFIAVIIAVTYYTLKGIKFIFREIAFQRITIPGFYPEWAIATYKLIRLLISAFALIVIFPYLPGSDSPAFRGVSIFFGILFSLGSTSAVANAVAGIIITYMRAFKIGDRVKISDTMGDIIEKNLLVTRVKTIKNEDITIPNSMVLGSHIINYSSSAKEPGLILHTSVTIGYDVPWRKVHELLISAAKTTKHVLEKPEPFVMQTGLNDFYITYEINAYTDTPNLMAVIYSELHQNIQDKFNESGVEIMSPHYTAARDGNRIAIPEENIPESYSTPSFRISKTGNGPSEKDSQGA